MNSQPLEVRQPMGGGVEPLGHEKIGKHLQETNFFSPSNGLSGNFFLLNSTNPRKYDYK